MEKFQVDQLRVEVYSNRSDAGSAAGKEVVETIHKLLLKKPMIRMIFAAAPSQDEVLEYLVRHQQEVDWTRITAFHMDEYLGLDEGSEQLFSTYLKDHIFDHVPFHQVHLINSKDPVEAERYARLINEAPIDIVCLGIGENGHLAFNDPPVADFSDPETVKIVELDEICRQQQVNDGCFPSLEEVPRQAITLTIPTLFNADHLF